ncbi:hypothetical protein BAY61_10100 [Prauserella marina]|uniref:Uncharacterized protein n=1 Tax=Prauserella marina TaxID=530584 RepID=A0A222VMZ4_9PSEU|nr:hypothetical protein [Prauserella marina]ASR35288.1 hypothetical protein BAY61_10100 [Prauserella marina]PWV84935.1 hypothetical protein DES30_101954 [Prauserella marina]SDC08957.1 hypothetical protein SAMN05421630_101383 [Prauserella marina]
MDPRHTGTADSGDLPFTPAERAELADLRAELALLRSRRSAPLRWLRSAGAGTLLFLGCLLVPVSLLAVWTHSQVADTDRFVATAAPLIREPAVRAVVTDRVTDAVFARIDVEGLAANAVGALAERGVPPAVTTALDGLTGPLAAGVRDFVHERVAGLLSRPGIAELWERTIRVAHEQAHAVLSGESDAVVVSGGTVELDLAPFATAAKERLVAAGLTVAGRIPEVHPTIAIADASSLDKARRAYSAFDSLAAWLPWITVLVLALGVYVARGHRRALVGAGAGIALSMLVLAGGLLVTRSVLTGAVPPPATIAAGESFDLLVRFLRDGLRTLFAVGVVLALGAFLAGPSATARGVRAGTGSFIGRLRSGRGPAGPAAIWVYRHQTPLRVALVAIAVAVFVFLDRPSGVTVLVISIVLLGCLAVVQFIGRPPRESAPGDSPGATEASR